MKPSHTRSAMETDATGSGDQNAQRCDRMQDSAQILEGNPIPTFVIDAGCKITHWNRACELLTGMPASEMIGTDRHRDVLYSQRRELMADLIVRRATTDEMTVIYGHHFKDSLQTRRGYQSEGFFPNLGKDGKWLLFTAAPLKDAQGRMIGAIETLQDITARRIAEQKLRASESRYRQLFESANDAIFVLKDGLIADCNQKALDLFDSSRQALIGSSPLELSTKIQAGGRLSEDEIKKRMALIQDNISQFFEWRFLRQDGSTFDAEVSLNRFNIFKDPHGLAIVRDISAKKRMVQALHERQTALDEKSTYLEKVNQALKASLDHREVEKRAVEENMLINLKRFVFPYMEELEACKLGSDAKAYLRIIQTNLDDIVSRFDRTIFSQYIHLTPTEVRIADLIRSGKNTKAIAALMALSPSSIQWHRKNIRQKLGLTNQRVNLHTYLNSLST